jgi:two-component system sensor histidine kinase/response regulator
MPTESVIDLKMIEMLRDLQDPNEPNLLKEIVDLFIASTPVRLEKIRAALSESNSRSLALEAHALKSGSANLGANAMRDLCLKLEELGNAGSIMEGARLLAALEQEFEKATTELLTFIK